MKVDFRQIYRRIIEFLPKKIVLNIENFRGYHRLVNFKNPKYFGEKIQYIKMYGNLEKYRDYVDKYLVRKYITDTIGSEYLIPLLGVYSTPNEIDYEKLPNSFVIKLNTGSGYNIIIKNKKNIDKNKISKKLNKWLKEDYSRMKKEPQYKNIDKKIIIEKYIVDSNNELNDFKFFCSEGKVHFIDVDYDRYSGHKINLYDVDWNLLDIKLGDYPNSLKNTEKPKNLSKMIEIAEKLSSKFNFVRVDLYNVNGKIYFGELTFTPGAGINAFKPLEKDIEFAKMIDISKYTYKKILYIGRISEKRKILDGVTIKARILQNELNKNNKYVKTVDVDNWNKKIFSTGVKMIFSYFNCDEIVICTSSPGASRFLKFLKLVRNKKNVYYFVSGGNLYKKIEDKTYPIDLYKNLYKIYVESQYMKEKFIEFGLTQTELKYNFRNPKIKFEQIKSTLNPVKFVFWGRVIKDKGIEQAIELINKLTHNENSVELYIYGQVENDYLKNLKIEKYDNIYYMGTINPDGKSEYEILHKYDIFIFPTEHDGEGLPGALIDAYISGLCVVASNWMYAHEYIKDDYNGIIFEYKNYDDMFQKVLKLINNKEKIDFYKRNSLVESEKYIIKNIMPKELVGEKYE